MPSTYTTNLGIEKIATGEQSGTWGTTTNTNLDLIDEAVNGVEQVTLAAAGSSGSPNDLPVTNGASSDGRNKFIEFIDGGDLGGTAYVQLTPNDAEKVVHIRNSLSAARNIIIFQGTYNASNDFEIPNGADVVLKFDGAGAGAVVSDVNVNLTPTKITTATADITTGNITTVNATTVDSTNLEVTNLKAKDGTSAGSIADSTGVVTLASSVLTTTDINGGSVDGATLGTNSAITEAQVDNININGNAITSTDTNGNIALTPDGTGEVDISKVDIDGGTIDGTTIGGSTPAAGSFTTITGSGDMAIDTDTLFVDVSEERVGINNSSPVSPLDIFDGSRSIATRTGIKVRDDAQSASSVLAETKALHFFGASDTETGYISFEHNQGYGNLGSTNIAAVGTRNVKMLTNGNQRMFISFNGDISFYEDTGTTPKLFWDASAESLGIGTSSPTQKLDIRGSGSQSINVGSTDGTSARLVLDASNGDGAGGDFHEFLGDSDLEIKARNSSDNANLIFTNDGGQRMRLDASGNLIVGMTSTGSTNGAYITQGGNIVCASEGGNSTSSLINWTSPGFSSGSSTKYGLRLESGTGDDFEFGYFTDVVGSVGSIIDTSGTNIGTVIRSGTNGVRLSNGATSWSSYSDERLKNVNGEIDSALDKVDALRGVYFSWKNDEENNQRCGLIAQEVEQVLPEVVDNDTDFMQVRYTEIIPLLVQAIKELKAEIETLKGN